MIEDNARKSIWKAALEYITPICIGCIFLLSASSWTSPLYPYSYGYDSAWYSLAGRSIVLGRVPYVDFFDLKGPVLFFYEAIGQFFIRGRGGVFLIQLLSMSFTVVFLWKISRLFLSRKNSTVVLLLFFYIYYYLLWGGNTVEELFMPFNMAALYFGIRFLLKYDTDVKRPAFIFGLGFSLIALSKLTVASTLISAAVTVLIILIKEKKYREILISALYFLFGTLFVLIPVLFYFGFHNAISDFIFCTFSLALRRSVDYYVAFSWNWEWKLIICFGGLIIGLLLPKKYARIKLLLIVISIIVYGSLHLGTPYLYYFISQMPLFSLMLIFSILYGVESFKDKLNYNGSFSFPVLGRNIIMAGVIIFILISYWEGTYSKAEENIYIYNEDFGREQVEGCLNINSYIPAWEKEEVYNLESGMIYYEVNQLLPVNKYSVNLPYFLHLHPPIGEEVKRYLTGKRPKWIISERMEGFDEDWIRAYVFNNYELVADNEGEELYRRISP